MPSAGLPTEVHEVHVGAEPDVVAQVPAHVIRIEVQHDVVAVPEPVIYVVIFEGSDTEEKAVELEAIPAAAVHAPDVAGSDAAPEASVLPRMVEMQPRVVRTHVVTDPAIILDVHVRRLGMPGPVTEHRRGGMVPHDVHGGRASGGNVSPADVMRRGARLGGAVLRGRGNDDRLAAGTLRDDYRCEYQRGQAHTKAYAMETNHANLLVSLTCSSYRTTRHAVPS